MLSSACLSTSVRFSTSVCFLLSLDERDGEGADPDDEAEDQADVEEGAEGTDEDDDEDEDEVDGGDSSDEEDDTAEDGTVATVVGAAVAPSGFRIRATCPPLESEIERQEMIGQHILYGWDTADAQGWFRGTVHSRTLSARDLRATPSANYVVKYKPAETEKRLNGAVACELSERFLYGPTKRMVGSLRAHVMYV